MSTERTPPNSSRLFPNQSTPKRDPNRDAGLFGYTPQYAKNEGKLFKDWDRIMADPNNPARKVYEAKRQEGEERHARIHAKPASKLEADKLKAERAKAQARSHLIPRGPSAAYVRSSLESERERRIHHLDKCLGRQQGKAERGFNPASKGQTKGAMRGPER